MGQAMEWWGLEYTLLHFLKNYNYVFQMSEQYTIHLSFIIMDKQSIYIYKNNNITQADTNYSFWNEHQLISSPFLLKITFPCKQNCNRDYVSPAYVILEWYCDATYVFNA